MSKDDLINTSNSGIDFAIQKRGDESKERQSFPIPNQNVSFFYNSMTNSEDGEQLGLFKERSIRISKGSKYQVNEKLLAISKETANARIELELGNSISRPTKLIAIYILHQLGRQHIGQDLFDDIYIPFPLSELVNIGIFNSLRDARRGYQRAQEELTSIKLNASIRGKGKNASFNSVTKSEVLVMFTRCGRERGTCYISLNRSINWRKFALETYTSLPNCYWSLPDKAQDLCYNIFSQARQQTKRAKGGEITFPMLFRTIQAILKLPDEKTVKNAKRDTFDKIITAIETCQKQIDPKKEEFILEPVYDSQYGNLQTLLGGCLKVTLRGSMAKTILEIAKHRENFIIQGQAKKASKSLTQSLLK